MSSSNSRGESLRRHFKTIPVCLCLFLIEKICYLPHRLQIGQWVYPGNDFGGKNVFRAVNNLRRTIGER